MLKKMMLLAMAVVAVVAFAAPAMAQAEVVLTEENQPLEEGAEITATSTNLVTTFTGGSLQCSKVTFHFEVKTNGPEHVVLTTLNHTEGTTEGCNATATGVGTVPATITDPTLAHEVTINTWGTATAAASFKSDAPLLGLSECSLAGTVHFQASGGSNIGVGPSGLTGGGGSAGCPTSGTIEGTLALETADGTPIVLDYVAT